MLPFVIRPDGTSVYPEDLDEEAWNRLKEMYSVGDFTAPCCGAPAIPKTSGNFLQFFAHYADGCATSPESQWHVTTKDIIIRTLDALGVKALLERPVSGASGNLKSDVYFEMDTRKIAIEVQHSYQSLQMYLKRQSKYVSCEIENYWLLYKPRFKTVTISIAKHQIRSVHGGRIPKDRVVGSTRDLPISLFDTEDHSNRIRGPGGVNASMEDWLKSILRGSFQFKDNLWRILD